MSIIEKALEKRSGDVSKAASESISATTQSTDIPLSASSSVAAAGDNLNKAVERRPVEETAASTSSRDHSSTSSRYVKLDMERLNRCGMLTPQQARSQIAEELRIIKRPLLINAFGKGASVVDRGNLIMVTSALPGEGKTFTAVNLAMSVAMELDRTVLLVDADVAKPSVTRLMGIEAEFGLIDVLLDNRIELSDALIKTDIPKLTVLPAGSHYPKSTELLASDAMEALANELSERYADRVIIFDTPPLLAATQASVLSRFMGQAVMVVEASSTPQHVVQEALTHLDSTEVVGMVLNKIRQKSGSNYYGYGYYGT